MLKHRCLNTDLPSECNVAWKIVQRDTPAYKHHISGFPTGGRHKYVSLTKGGENLRFRITDDRFTMCIATHDLCPRLLRPKVTAKWNNVRLPQTIDALSAKFMSHPVLFTLRLIINYQSWSRATGPLRTRPAFPLNYVNLFFDY